MATHSMIDGDEVLDDMVKPFRNWAYVTVLERWRGADVNVVQTSIPEEDTE